MRLLKSNALLSGTTWLFISMTVVNAGNYIFNLILGRWLGPVAFADLSLIVTLMLVVTLGTATLQTVAARFSAIHTAKGTPLHTTGLRNWLGKRAWLGGFLLCALLAFGAPLWQKFFHTASMWPFILLGIGMPFYLAQGVDRGVMQGRTLFKKLSWSYQAEMWVRLITAVGLVALGWSVNGAVLGLTLSFIATWWVARQVRQGLPMLGSLSSHERTQISHYTTPVSIALVGQILINNSDILIVKHFFISSEAGQYAALALIGRIVFFATWSVVTVMFPIVAQKKQNGEPHRHLLHISLGLVLTVSILIISATIFYPEQIVSMLFGSAYLQIAPLLWLYGIATALYALGNVYVHYHLSLGNTAGSIFTAVAGACQIVSLWLFHDSLAQVVAIQIGLMSILLITLFLWDIYLQTWVSHPIPSMPHTAPKNNYVPRHG